MRKLVNIIACSVIFFSFFLPWTRIDSSPYESLKPFYQIFANPTNLPSELKYYLPLLFLLLPISSIIIIIKELSVGNQIARVGFLKALITLIMGWFIIALLYEAIINESTQVFPFVRRGFWLAFIGTIFLIIPIAKYFSLGGRGRGFMSDENGSNPEDVRKHQSPIITQPKKATSSNSIYCPECGKLFPNSKRICISCEQQVIVSPIKPRIIDENHKNLQQSVQAGEVFNPILSNQQASNQDIASWLSRKKIMVIGIIGAIAIAIILFSLFANFFTRELSREEATSLITQYYKLPFQTMIGVDVFYQNYGWPPEKYHQLENQGFLVKRDAGGFIISRFKVIPTEKARQYWIRNATIEEIGEKVHLYVFQGYMVDIMNISISSNAGENKAEAEVIFKNYDFSPIFTIFNSSLPNQSKLIVYFKLYDSGWKVDEEKTMSSLTSIILPMHWAGKYSVTSNDSPMPVADSEIQVSNDESLEDDNEVDPQPSVDQPQNTKPTQYNEE